MSSTASKSVAEVSPAPPVFSYAQVAQAAKRSATSATTSNAPSNPATSGISTPAKGASSIINTPSGGSERGDQSVNGSIEASSRIEQSGDNVVPESKVASSTQSVSRPVSPSLGSASVSTLPKEEVDDFILVGGPTDSARDRSAQDKTAGEKSSEGTEGRKGKKGKKQKNAEKEAAEKEKEKEKEEVKPLVPAPLPSVNFWSVRKAEAAKTKPAAVSQSQQTPTEPSISNDTNKVADAKKRSKTDESDKSVGAAQNGGPKDVSSPAKQKKNVDGSGKAKDDQSTKRSGPRGSRVPEEKPAPSQLPPPVEDPMSWPTPETALEEEKRNVQEKEKPEKEEKDENGSNKPRQKKDWVTVPYVPTVNFNTPLPQRGGRGRGGARGGRTEAGGRSNHAANAGGAGEKAQNGSTAAGTSSGDTERRLSRGEAPRAGSIDQTSSKRPSSDPAGSRDQRKPSVAAGAEKSKGGAKGESSVNADFIANIAESHSNQPQAEHSRNFKSEQGASYDNSSRGERRSEPTLKGFEQPKEGANMGKDSTREGRSERGRGGGFRSGRNHPNSFSNGQQHPQNIFTNGHGPQPPNGYSVRSAGPGPYSPPLAAPPFSNQYPMPSSRGGRGGSRAGSVPNTGMYGRYPTNGGPNAQHMPPLQTSNAMYDYQPMQSMSAMPYNQYLDDMNLIGMIGMQLQYYFSIDNLCRDIYLRKHMDSKGFVSLAFIAKFKRIQALTQDYASVRLACQEADNIELVEGDDRVDRVRRTEGWEKWVLDVEDRDESAKNDGPSQFIVHYPSRMRPMPGNHAMSPQPFSPNGVDYRHYGNGAPVEPVMNGNGNHYHPETPLSAAVPEFAPGVPLLSDRPDPLMDAQTFPDEKVPELNVLFQGGDSSAPKAPFHNASSRTFSNGSVDGRSIAEEIADNRQGRALTNGSRAIDASSHDAFRRSRSPFTPLSPTKASFDNAPPVMWKKGARTQVPISESNTEEPYTIFHSRALKQRDASAPGKTHYVMASLYQFWSHFLCRNFNLTMYNEFRYYAFEDAKSQAMDGVNNLISFYDEILNSKKKVIHETLARHYVELVESEESNERPAFLKLRAAWRNGALDMKSRKRIDNYLSIKLKEDLEQSVIPKMNAS